VINLGTGIEVSIREVGERILRLLGREVPVIVSDDRMRPSNSEVSRLMADRRKAETLLGWRPEIDLDEGLRRTIEWMSGALDSYKASIYNV
jgi:dTDP-glucose 4,6-dehydratase